MCYLLTDFQLQVKPRKTQRAKESQEGDVDEVSNPAKHASSDRHAVYVEALLCVVKCSINTCMAELCKVVFGVSGLNTRTEQPDFA